MYVARRGGHAGQHDHPRRRHRPPHLRAPAPRRPVAPESTPVHPLRHVRRELHCVFPRRHARLKPEHRHGSGTVLAREGDAAGREQGPRERRRRQSRRATGGGGGCGCGGGGQSVGDGRSY